jgi:F-type H+-transporting ATPase subunit c
LSTIKKKWTVRLSAAKYISSGICVSGLIGAGAGVGVVFASLILAISRNPSLKDGAF